MPPAYRDAFDRQLANAITNWRSTVGGLLTMLLVPLGAYATIYHGPKTMTLAIIVASVKGWISWIQKD